MAKFRFRLETLLKLQVAARDQRRAQLAEAYEAERILEEQDRKIVEELDDLKQTARQIARPGEVNVERLIDSHRYELVLLARRQMIGQQGEQLSAEIERRRQRLVEADRQVRVLEKLREKKWDAYRQEENKQEHKHIDEISLQRIVGGNREQR